MKLSTTLAHLSLVVFVLAQDDYHIPPIVSVTSKGEGSTVQQLARRRLVEHETLGCYPAPTIVSAFDQISSEFYDSAQETGLKHGQPFQQTYDTSGVSFVFSLFYDAPCSDQGGPLHILRSLCGDKLREIWQRCNEQWGSLRGNYLRYDYWGLRYSSDIRKGARLNKDQI